MSKTARKRRGVTVSVDPQTHSQISDLSKRYTEEWGKPVSRTDIVRMGLTALALVRERGKVAKPR